MKRTPKDIYDILEFDKILAETEKYCFGELGRKYFNNFIHSTNPSQIEQWLSEVYEYSQSFENKHNIPISSYNQITEDLQMLSIEGYVLSIESLCNIAKTLLISSDIFNFFNNTNQLRVH